MSMETPIAVHALKIVVPIAKEDGWQVSSPGETVKARLEARSPKSKSPEAVKEKDERAAALAALHLEAIKMRAQRDLERVAENERRRLRAAAAEKARIIAKAEASDKKALDKRGALEAEAAEKRARREALKAAFFENRESIMRNAATKGTMLAERTAAASAKRTKLLQATVHKANYEVKHAIAVATAAKEKEREAAAQASSSLDERLAAASCRRLELLGSPPKSPSKEAAGKSARERARQVAHVLNDEAVALEQKRVRLAAAMDKALASRDARLEATVRKAALHKEKAARAKAALQARQASVDGLAHSIIEKGQAAEVRRLLHLRSIAHKKRAPVLIEIPLERRADATPPAALVARLSAQPTVSPDALAARHAAAAAAREAKSIAAKAIHEERADCAAAVIARRIAADDARVAKLSARSLTIAPAVAAAKAKRAASAIEMNKRVGAAAAKRNAKRYAELGRLLAKAQKREIAATKRAAITYARCNRAEAIQRAAALVAKRAALAKGKTDQGELQAKKGAAAAERRARVLSERVARARMGAIVRTAAVKLTAASAGGVEVSLVQPDEKRAAVELAAEQKQPPTEVDEPPVVVRCPSGTADEKAPNFLSRLVGRFFGK